MTAKSLKEDSGLFAVAETEARAWRAAGRLVRRAAGDAVTLEFLEFGGDVVAGGDELAAAQLGQGGRQKQRGKLLGRVLLLLAVLGRGVDQFADRLAGFHDALGGNAAAMRIAQQKTGIGGDARGIG